MSSRNRAFTLVELLVVIGIIAVLISVLLPALNKARQQANLIDCQSRLRQMGQVLYIYAHDNKGLLPYGGIDRPEPWEDKTFPNAKNKEFTWWWYMELGQLMNKNVMGSDGFVHNLPKVFQDRDTVDPTGNVNYVNHYTANERVFYGNWDNDYGPGWGNGALLQHNDLILRKLGSLKPNNVFLFWDAPQCMNLGGNSYGLATELDGNELTFGTCFMIGSPNPVNYNRPVTPGLGAQSQNASVCRSVQKKFNIDIQDYLQFLHLRFRHLNNTRMNALCLDGHVESREVGTAMVLDFCTNYPFNN